MDGFMREHKNNGLMLFCVGVRGQAFHMRILFLQKRTHEIITDTFQNYITKQSLICVKLSESTK